MRTHIYYCLILIYCSYNNFKLRDVYFPGNNSIDESENTAHTAHTMNTNRLLVQPLVQPLVQLASAQVGEFVVDESKDNALVALDPQSAVAEDAHSAVAEEYKSIKNTTNAVNAVKTKDFAERQSEPKAGCFRVICGQFPTISKPSPQLAADASKSSSQDPLQDLEQDSSGPSKDSSQDPLQLLFASHEDLNNDSLRFLLSHARERVMQVLVLS